MQGKLGASLHLGNFDRRVFVFSNSRLEAKLLRKEKTGRLAIFSEGGFSDPEDSDVESSGSDSEMKEKKNESSSSSDSE